MDKITNEYMQLAYKEAIKAYKKNEVPVGAVIVRDGIIIAKAHNLRENRNSALAHAEVLCIEKASKKLNSWRLDGAEMYVTLEPCAMCAGALIQSRIHKVYIGARDNKNGCVGSITNIFEVKTTHKIEYEYAKDAHECSQILTDFFSDLRRKKQKLQ